MSVFHNGLSTEKKKNTCRRFILQIKPLTIFVTSIKYKQVIILLKHSILNVAV